MGRSLVLKKTKYLFLVFAFASFSLALAVHKFSANRIAETMVKRIVSAVIGGSVSINAQEHPFIPFGQTVFTNMDIRGEGLDMDVATLYIGNSAFSLFNRFFFGNGKLNARIYDANLSLVLNEAADASAGGDVEKEPEDAAREHSDGFSKIKSFLSEFEADVRISGLNVSLEGRGRSARIDGLSLLLDLERDLKIRNAGVSLSSAKLIDDEGDIEVFVEKLKSISDDTMKVSGFRVRTPHLNAQRDGFEFKWFLDGERKTFGFDFPDMEFEAYETPMQIDDLRVKTDYSNGNASLSIESDAVRSEIDENAFLNLKGIRFSAELNDRLRLDNMSADFDFDVQRSGGLLVSAPIAISWRDGGTLEASSQSVSSPFLSRACALESSFSNNLLNARVYALESHPLDLNFILDLNQRLAWLNGDIGIEDISINPFVHSLVNQTKPAHLDMHLDLNSKESQLDFEWMAEVFNLPISVDLGVSADERRIAFSGKGLEIGPVNIQSPSDLSFSDESRTVSFPVSYSKKHVAEIDLSSIGNLLGFDLSTDSGKFAISAAIDPSLQNKRLDVSVKLLEESYDFFCFLFENGVNIYSDRFQAGFDFSKGLSAYVSAVDFLLPDLARLLGPSDFKQSYDPDRYVIANIDFAFASDVESRTIAMRNSHTSFVFPDFSIGWDLGYEQSQFNMRNFLFASPEVSFSGGGYIKGDFFDREFYKTLEGDLRFQSSDGNSKIVLNMACDSAANAIKLDVVLNPAPRITGFRRIALGCDFSTDWEKDFSIRGKASLLPVGSDDEFDVSVYFKDGMCDFHCDEFRYSAFKAMNIDLKADLAEKTAFLRFDGAYDYKRLDKTVKITFSPELDVRIEDDDFSIRDIASASKRMKLSITGITIDYDDFGDLTTDITTLGNRISFANGFVSGEVDTASGKFDLALYKPFPINGAFKGSISDGAYFIDCDIAALPVWLSRYFVVRPIFEITSGVFRGKALIAGNAEDANVYCHLYSDEMKIWEFWTENEYMTINNLNVIGNGHDVRLLRTTATSVNKSTSRITFFEVEAGISLENMVNPFWYINAFIPENQKVEVNIPIPYFDYNVNIMEACGDFSLIGRGMDNVEIQGDVFGANALVSKPMQAPFFVFGAGGDGDGEDTGELVVPQTEVDLNIRTGKNIRIVYPDTKNPIVSAVLKEGQKVRMVYSDRSNGKFYIEGKTEIESGDVYYLKRRFNIESGDITWDRKRSTLDVPLINLKASYRDYDKTKGGVDLYINISNATFDLSNSTFDSLKPVFSSSGGLTENEVMTRLGQAVLQTDTSNGNLQYLTSLSVTMLDLFSNLSNSTQFASFVSFPDDMGVNLDFDVFMLQTNFLANFISDATPSLLNQRGRTSGNAFSRYIDGTSLKMAKRITPKIMLSFSTEFINVSDVEITHDRGISLGGDLLCLMTLGAEFELEPFDLMFLFRPSDFSIPGFLSGYGFSVSKSFIF